MNMWFCAEISDFKIVTNVLKAIAFKENAIIRPMEEGLKVTIEEMKCVETSAYFPRALFSSYHMDSSDGDIIFSISLNCLTDCLSMCGDDSNPTLRISCKSLGEPLCLLLKHSEENLIVDCEIRMMTVDNFTDISLAEECNINKVVFNATILVELLQRLDNSSDIFKLYLSPDIPNCKMSASGIHSDSEVSVLKNSESLTLFECTETSEWQYSYSHIRPVIKVMAYADKVAISTGQSGLLGMQLVIKSGERQMYVEYYVTSQVED